MWLVWLSMSARVRAGSVGHRGWTAGGAANYTQAHKWSDAGGGQAARQNIYGNFATVANALPTIEEYQNCLGTLL